MKWINTFFGFMRDYYLYIFGAVATVLCGYSFIFGLICFAKNEFLFGIICCAFTLYFLACIAGSINLIDATE